MNKPALFLSLPILACLGSAAFADMGRIMLSNSDVKVEETSQKAVILHNRREEVLILGTEIGAAAATPIVRFIPFPAEPQVSAAPVDTFDRVKAMVEKYRLSFVTRWMTKGGGSDKTQGVDVVAAARVGSHDVTTIHVSDVAAFRGWVNGYFRAHGLPTAAAYPGEEAIVSDYVRRGYTYFVLDRVDVDAKVRLVEPLGVPLPSRQPLLSAADLQQLRRQGRHRPVRRGAGDVVPPRLQRSGRRLPRRERRSLRRSRQPRQVPERGFQGEHFGSAGAQENDLGPIFADWRAFFGDDPVYLQAMRRRRRPQVRPRRRRPVARRGAGAQGRSDRPADVPRPGRTGASGRLPGQTGPGACKGAFEAYWFDAKAGACKSFLWGGCGDPPPFDTLSDCQRACLPQ